MALNRSPVSKTKELSLPMSRVKTIMKSSPEVENISQESLYLVTRATELFIQYLTQEAFRISGHHKMDYKHIAEIVQTREEMEFLREIMPRKITYKQYKELMTVIETKGLNGKHSSSDSDESSSEESGSSED